MEPRAREELIVHAFASEVLRRVCEVFEREQIDVLAVKGVATAYSLYENASERPISDVDLRVRPDAIERARDAGVRAGWKLLLYSPTYKNAVFEIGGVMIDIEAAIGSPGVCGITINELFTRAERRKSPIGVSYLVPEVHDHAIFLAVNAFKDKMVHANRGAIEDLTRIVRVPEFDASTLIDRARSGGVVTLLWIVADWMAGARNDAVWKAIGDRIGSPPRRMYADAYRFLLRTNADRTLSMRILARAVNDRPLRRAVALGGLAKYWLELRRQARHSAHRRDL